MPTNTVCGIDFGTSNSTVAIAHQSDRTLVPLEDGRTTLPSSIFFPHRAMPLFGREATQAYLDGEEGRLLRGLKKILGTSLMDDKTTIGNKAVAFTQILQTFIDHLKSRAEEFSGSPIEHVVMGRPVHFHDNDPGADQKSQATLETIAKAAGFNHIEFLYEPIAAAFAHESKIADEKLSLVIDLGGGTSDFTVIRISKDKMAKADRRDDILATSGVRIGGTTFDYRLSMKSFMPALGMGTKYKDMFDPKKLMPVPASVYAQLSDWAMVHFAQTKKAVNDTLDIKRRAVNLPKIERLWTVQQNHLGHALLEKVEESKIALTETNDHTAYLKDLGEHCPFATTRVDFETAISKDVDKVFTSIAECLSLAGIKEKQIDLIILTGGSTELPMINLMVQKMFPHAQISQGNKLDSVGLGLAYRAANIFQAKK